MGQQYASSPQGSGEIAMTEGELARFFGVTWRALNYRIQAIQKYSNPYPEEMCASKREIVRWKEVVGYAPLYPLSAIIALSFLLDSTEAHLFRRYACQKVQQQAATITPIFLFGGIHHWLIPILFLSPILSYYITTIKGKTVKEKWVTCSNVCKIIVLRSNYIRLFIISNSLWILPF